MGNVERAERPSRCCYYAEDVIDKGGGLVGHYHHHRISPRIFEDACHSTARYTDGTPQFQMSNSRWITGLQDVTRRRLKQPNSGLSREVSLKAGLREQDFGFARFIARLQKNRHFGAVM